ncbi:ribosome recycling factor [Candidatus Sumerlaeota bacterium]|nr:ribosome recycling factor [Candidatus Sumerlaeota bacterium]
MFDTLLKDADHKMDKAIETLERDLTTLRTGRASIQIVDGVKANAYGTETPLQQLATINTPDAATIAIQPWDVSLLSAIEKAIHAANLGLTPSNDGKVIRLRVPQLTEESRKGIVKKGHEMAEHARVAERNVRRHVNDEFKKAEKDHKITEDECKRQIETIQKKTDAHIKRIDEMLTKKEKEIMHV